MNDALRPRQRRVEIRTALPADAPRLAEIYAPIVSETPISFEESAPSAGEMERRIAQTSPAYPWLVAVDRAGEVTGYAYASAHRSRAGYRWSVDVSAYVAQSARGGGVGKRLYGSLLRVLAAQRFYRAYAGIALPNDASIALHRSAGFALVGTYRNVGFKCGSWRDVSWW
ncbi:MAG: N-acetyltransferase, partial [Candidatus Eremiobacteraeota bacterium]|nr:N-acetyltransferase [Candidatus Eremiobacteraeota bacterium]